jgi:hypothetical protein
VLALCRSFQHADTFERNRTMDLFQATDVEFDMTHALAGLKGSGISCPPPDAALIDSYVKEALR